MIQKKPHMVYDNSNRVLMRPLSCLSFTPCVQVEDPYFALIQLAQTTMRSELGKITLDKTFEERESLNEAIVQSISHAAKAWGIQCLRYEIRKKRLTSRLMSRPNKIYASNFVRR